MARIIRSTDRQPRLKALFLIVDWDKLNVVSEVFAGESCLLSFVSNANGTASSEIMGLLGIGSTEKAVFLCLVQSRDTPHIIREIRRAMGAQSAGAGIAFSVPLGGVTARILTMFAEARQSAVEQGGQAVGNERSNTQEGEVMKAIEIKHEIIISVLNSGNSEAFMTEARKAGARGGTVINARGISQEAMKKFLGMSVQDEKEIIFILADKETVVPIMDAVKTDFGVSSKAAGVIFSLPVDQVMSLNALA
ncbi:nitrogen regulatory protein P-II [Spirochaetia bacterium]|nr:nitrogen regulatory protein P-II [Spirochaetia bacterium]